MDGEEQEKPPGYNWLRSPIWLVLFALVLAALIVSAIMGRPIFKLGSKAPTVTVKEYRDDDQGFSLNYPGNWQKLSPEELAKFQGAFAFAIRRTRPDALFSIKTQEMKTKNVDLKQVAKALDKAMPKNFENFKKIDQEIFDINGRQALRYDYVFSAQPQLEVREQLIIVATPNKVFHLTAWAAAKNFSRVKPDFDKISSGFTAQ